MCLCRANSGTTSIRDSDAIAPPVYLYSRTFMLMYVLCLLFLSAFGTIKQTPLHANDSLACQDGSVN